MSLEAQTAADAVTVNPSDSPSTKTDEERIAEMVSRGVPEGTAWSILSTEKGDTVGDIVFMEDGKRIRAADCEEGREMLEAAKDVQGHIAQIGFGGIGGGNTVTVINDY